MNLVFLSSIFFTSFSSPSLSNDNNSLAVPDWAIVYINQAQNLWVASKSWVGSMTIHQAKSLTSSSSESSNYPLESFGALKEYIQLPNSFDSRTAWPNCIHPIINQGQCGSDWAISATEVMSDRFCISSSGSINVILSVQYLIDCDSNSSGCNGGFPANAWKFMQENGLPSTQCIPYTGSANSCPKTCTGGGPMTLYKTGAVNTYSGASSIQTAIMNSGPVQTTMTVYQDFLTYTSGIYVHTFGGLLGSHSVKILGWGTQGSVVYWICANTWGLLGA